jgi:hypothetical protein
VRKAKRKRESDDAIFRQAWREIAPTVKVKIFDRSALEQMCIYLGIPKRVKPKAKREA